MKIFGGEFGLGIVDGEGHIHLMQRPVGPVLGGKALRRAVQFAKDRIGTPEHNQVPDAGSHQMKALGSLASRQHELNACQTGQHARYPIDVARAIAVNPSDSTVAAMVLEILVPVHRDRDANRRAALGADLLQIPAIASLKFMP